LLCGLDKVCPFSQSISHEIPGKKNSRKSSKKDTSRKANENFRNFLATDEHEFTQIRQYYSIELISLINFYTVFSLHSWSFVSFVAVFITTPKCKAMAQSGGQCPPFSTIKLATFGGTLLDRINMPALERSAL